MSKPDGHHALIFSMICAQVPLRITRLPLRQMYILMSSPQALADYDDERKGHDAKQNDQNVARAH